MAARLAGPAAALAVVAATLLAPSASARPPWAVDIAAIDRGLERAVAAGRVDEDAAAAYRETLRHAATALPRLRGSRYRNLAAVVHQVATLARTYNGPRAIALFSMLDFNVRWFSRHWDRRPNTDRIDNDGILYRAFPDIGFQFHPLGNFGRLNWLVASGQDDRAEQLAAALTERGVSRAGGTAWEYYFRFGGGAPPWISGMAQAVAAQALARAGRRLQLPELVTAGGRAYAIVPSLLRTYRAGPWIRLYAFSGVSVLNAQLQTVLSLRDYGAQAEDVRAADLADRLEAAARTLLPRFDTGSWSRYSLDGPEATLHYHTYVVTLLRTLARRTRDPVFAAYEGRFRRYLTEPPVVTPGRSPKPIYPWPVDAFRDSARLVFHIDKRSTVRAVVGGSATAPVVVTRGVHDLPWRPGAIVPGTYLPSLHAVDVAGNASDTELAPVVVRRDTKPPRLAAGWRRGRLWWRAVDRETPWLTLKLLLRRPNATRTLTLGRSAFRGSARVRVPSGVWTATLYAADSSGNTASSALGVVGGRGG